MAQPISARELGATAGAFPIVALGGSAGGLAPTIELIRGLGPRPDVALVVIHHLDPTHESGLVEILARATTMSVDVARDDVRVEPNHVYVVPPNAGLLIVGGVLKLVAREEIGGLHLPIDRFCESLAKDREGFSVAVVLSGSGCDGTAGVRAIKSEGGLTLAQDSRASFSSMPSHAIATGCVDFVGSPTELARELGRIGAHAPILAVPTPNPAGDPEYALIVEAMSRASGVDFGSYRHATIRRRIQRRLFLRGAPDLPAYLEMVRGEPDELHRLCEEALIHVTSFFREPDAFESLRTNVFRELSEGRSREAPLRIWVPGCSTGEEVYSIAMCLVEFLGEAKIDVPLKIFGTDLSAATIERARAARYPIAIERDVSAARLQRFFTPEEAGYRIRRELRDQCVFAKHDVTSDPPFSALDLISCRNLMIYLVPELQNRVVSLFHYALREPGFLMLGSSETARAFAGFATVDGKNKIYMRTSATPPLGARFASARQTTTLPAPAAPSMDAATTSGASGRTDVFREADRLVIAGFAPPGVVVTGDLAIIQFRGQTGPYLQPAPGAASLDLFRMAREELRLPLRRALDRARTTECPAEENGVELRGGDPPRIVSLQVIPFALHPIRQRFFLVLFEDSAHAAPPEGSVIAGLAEPHGDAAAQELASTRQFLESVVEQLEATNEELRAANEQSLSSNEELLSTNEELESAKEELQATVAELRLVNEELADRNNQASQLNDDLTNVLHSAEIPILIVGRDLRLRRFTPAAARAFGLVTADIGRGLDTTQTLPRLVPDVVALVTSVLELLAPAERSIQDLNGRRYRLAVRPYVTVDGRIDGVVLAARDVDAETRAAEALVDLERDRTARAELGFRDALASAAEGILMIDAAGRVLFANPSADRLFGYALGELVGSSVDLLLPGRLRAAHSDDQGARVLGADGDLFGRQKDGAAFPIEISLSTLARDGQPVIVAFVTDTTERRKAEAAIRAYQERLQQMAFDAAITEERERRRLATDLHDGIGQDLALAKIKLSPLRNEGGEEARATVQGAIALLEKAIDASRTLVSELSPPVLYDLGLEEAIAWLAEDLEQRHGIEVRVTDDGLEKRLPEAAGAIVFRCVRELVMNVLKHARVASAQISIRRSGSALHIDVRDRGVGFDPAPLLGRSSLGRFGLLSIREQLTRLGGTLEIDSVVGEGTLVGLSIPLPAAPPPLEASAPRDEERGA